LESDGRISLDVADGQNAEWNHFLDDRRDGNGDRRRALRAFAFVCAYIGAEIGEQANRHGEHAGAAEHQPAFRGIGRLEARSHAKIHDVANEANAPRIPLRATSAAAYARWTGCYFFRSPISLLQA